MRLLLIVWRNEFVESYFHTNIEKCYLNNERKFTKSEWQINSMESRNYSECYLYVKDMLDCSNDNRHTNVLDFLFCPLHVDPFRCIQFSTLSLQSTKNQLNVDSVLYENYRLFNSQRKDKLLIMGIVISIVITYMNERPLNGSKNWLANCRLRNRNRGWKKKWFFRENRRKFHPWRLKK